MPAKQPNDAIGAVMPKDLQAFEGALGDAPDAGVPVEPGAEAVPGGEAPVPNNDLTAAIDTAMESEGKIGREKDEMLCNEDLKAVLFRAAMIEWRIKVEGDNLKELADKVWALIDTTCIDVNATGRKARLGAKLMTEDELEKSKPKR